MPPRSSHVWKRHRETPAGPTESRRIWSASIAKVRHTLGHAADSGAALSEVITDDASIAAYDIAQVCAWRGEVDHAFEWLERAYAQRDTGMPLLAIDRFLTPLHNDPRWIPLLRKVGLAG